MLDIQEITSGAGDLCKPVLESVPAWFGIEEANQHYLDYIDNNPTFVAMKDDICVGFLSVKQHFPQSAEIYVVAIHRDYHRQGIGRRLLEKAEEALKENGTLFLQVKTLSDKHPDKGYAQTRAFYLGVGFVPIEEFPDLWGASNPALQLIKAL